MNLKMTYILLASLVIIFSSCDSMAYEDQEEQEISIEGREVYLSINRTQAADTKTINEDITTFEDRVHDLALFIFDSSTGEKISEYFDEEIPLSDTEKTFTVKLTTGLRDFYFVANMPMAALKTINNKTEMIAYMSTFRDLDIKLYEGAKIDKGFPMSRIYLNQTITEGGNIYSPKLFQPTVNGSIEDHVKLIRAVAKLEVVLDGVLSNSGVKNIYYRNAYRQFGFISGTYPTSISHYADNPLTKVRDSYIYYMPEAMMMNTNPVWSATNHKPINCFLIETLDGTFYEIPIITDSRTISGSDYITFATGKLAKKPDYNIYCNRHYYYQIKNLQTIEVLYTVALWNIEKNTTYMGYGYNVNISDDGKIRIENTVNACSPHSIELRTVLPFTFSDGTTVKTFNNYDIDAYTEYVINPIPQKRDGDYLELYYNGIKMKTFSK